MYTESRTTGTPTQCTWEQLLETVSKVDDPDAGVVAEKKMSFRLASVLEWRWEGKGVEWDGSLSEEAVRGREDYKGDGLYECG